MFPKDLLATIQNELEATIDDMLNNPDNYGLPSVLNRDGSDELVEDQDAEWIKKAIANNWSHINR
jgi:hypothetical protein